ncbi:hypothetical protein Aduo_001522 [Ancylostoma duodenale]
MQYICMCVTLHAFDKRWQLVDALVQCHEASPAYAEVKFRFLLSEPQESTSRSDINENGHDRARLPPIMKRRQDLPEKRHLLHPEDEVFEESFVLDPLSSLPPERRASHNQVEDVFVESEHKKRRRRGRRRSG